MKQKLLSHKNTQLKTNFKKTRDDSRMGTSVKNEYDVLS